MYYLPKMSRKIKEILLITLLSLIPVFLIWFPFLLRLKSFWTIPLPTLGMATIVSNYDGPFYIVIAKSLYIADIIKKFALNLPVEYYAAHFPLYPLLIKLFAPFLGFPYSSLFVTQLSSILALFLFFKFINQYTSYKEAIWLTLVFSIFPARWLIVRSVGSPEPLFLAAIIGSILFFQKKKYLLAGIFGILAQLTKSPGILLFLAYLGFLFLPKIKVLITQGFNHWKKDFNFQAFLPTLLIPIFLIGLFIFYKFRFNNFFAYFSSGDNIHLFFPPFQIFNYSAPWVGTFWLEEIIFVYLIGIMGFLKLLEKKETLLAWFTGIFLLSTFFVSHRDLIRYSLPMVPFIITAFRETLIKKEFKITMGILFIPILLFSLAYIANNAIPISDWGPYL